ncbi:hypothetical protein CHARACLAT_019320 [Characodon lateralis]|uniref:Uncharacterized protein n=1 Tax=Characodon lateralis TaxID=208331 RepID=A0ABU7DAY0_9TELE|nr:hypothetical protein [Characodon lateralis]
MPEETSPPDQASVSSLSTAGHEGSLSFTSLFVLFQSAASSDGDYSRMQLQGCCSQTSLNSNGSLPGAGGHPGAAEHRVAGWSACFERLLQDSVGVRYFSVSRHEVQRSFPKHQVSGKIIEKSIMAKLFLLTPFWFL